MSDERCEPAENERNSAHYCWLQRGAHPVPVLWWASDATWQFPGSGECFTPDQMSEGGYRYIELAPTPSDLAAAKEREAALVGALRQIEGMIDNCAGLPSNPDSLIRMVQHDVRAVLDTHAPGWRTTP